MRQVVVIFFSSKNNGLCVEWYVRMHVQGGLCIAEGKCMCTIAHIAHRVSTIFLGDFNENEHAPSNCQIFM